MKKIISHLINFILMLATFSIIFLFIISSTILNKNYLIKSLETNNYYESIYHNIISSFESNLMPSGIEENILNKLITKEIVTTDLNNIINHIYNQEELKLYTLELRANFNQEINNILANNNKEASYEEQENIKRLEDTLASIYEDELLYSRSIIEQASTNYQTITHLIKISQIVLLLIIIDLIAIHFFLLKNSQKNIGISLLATGVINIIIHLSIINIYHQVLIINQAFSNVLKYIATSILTRMLISGILLTIIGLSLIIIYSKNKAKKVL